MDEGLIKETFFGLDDALVRLEEAAAVVEVLTTGTFANKATMPLHDGIDRLRRLVDAAWPHAVGKKVTA